MRIAVITCQAYKDTWEPFRALLQKFWPDCPYPVNFYSPTYAGETWCQVVSWVANQSADPILLMLDDFFLTAPVHHDLILHGLQQMYTYDAGCVRLYPCPGGIENYGDPYYAIAPKGTRYRISTQASLFKPSYLYSIASKCTEHGEASDFEHGGTSYSCELPEPVLAFKAEVRPLPMDYVCSAVSRGLWNPEAIRLCEQYGIPLDRSQREVAWA